MVERKHAQEVGCDALMILPVSYWPLTQDEVFEHYERVAGAIDMPICVYNNSWTTGLKGLKPAFDLLDHPVRLLDGQGVGIKLPPAERRGKTRDDTFRNRKFVDSLLEGDGFELSVPGRKRVRPFR
jgi:hypothetical protein